GDDKAFGDGDVYVEVAEFAIELALIEIGDRVPAAVVIDGGFGVPLCYLKRVVGVAAAGEIEGQFDVKGGRERDLAAGRQGSWEDDLNDIDVLRIVLHSGFNAVNTEIETVYIAALLFGG